MLENFKDFGGEILWWLKFEGMAFEELVPGPGGLEFFKDCFVHILASVGFVKAAFGGFGEFEEVLIFFKHRLILFLKMFIMIAIESII